MTRVVEFLGACASLLVRQPVVLVVMSRWAAEAVQSAMVAMRTWLLERATQAEVRASQLVRVVVQEAS